MNIPFINRKYGLNRYTYSADELMKACKVEIPYYRDEEMGVSIGIALDSLIRLSQVGKEFQGDCDGLDALCYCLDGYTCENAIDALNKVLNRFKELEKDKKENP